MGIDGDEKPVLSPRACQQLEFEALKQKDLAKEVSEEKLVRWE